MTLQINSCLDTPGCELAQELASLLVILLGDFDAWVPQFRRVVC